MLTSISCNWGWDESVPKHGKVTSLSLRGCFLQTTVYGERDKLLHIHLWLPTSRWLKLRGAIMYTMEGIGFGIRFDAPDHEDEQHLLSAINYFAANPPPKR
ncbi:MAG TPA: hypothetical protein VGW12_06935 [Pyrinomonadaceae bacterium]|nr:hypothetical protein [Pyrinomonadaceae bacterium]